MLAAGCSATNPLYEPSTGGGSGSGGATGPATTVGSDSIGGTSQGATGDGTVTDSGLSSTGAEESDSTEGEPDCRGLVHVQLSESTKPQVPRPVPTPAGPVVFFVDSNLAAGAMLSVARFFDGVQPGIEELAGPWAVDRSFIMAAGGAGLGVVLDSPAVLLTVEPGLGVIEERPLYGLDQFTISGLVRMGSDWLIPTIGGEDFVLLRYPDGLQMNDVGIPETGVSWVAGGGDEDGVVYIYRLASGPTCFAMSLTPTSDEFGKADLLTAGECLAPTLAFVNGSGGLATYYRGEEGPSTILGQRLGPTGLPLNAGGEFVIASGEDLHHPAVQRLPSGNYWVVWDDEGAMQAAELDGADPSVLLHDTTHFGGPTTFRKRTFVVDGHPAVAFHLASANAEGIGVHVVIDCDAG